MSDSANVLDEVRTPARELRGAIPETWAAFTHLHDEAIRDGALTAKTKELIAAAYTGFAGAQ
jgi:alkylhydroperoxidase/carboxymuconolactone decarboxylase family protein YurZ